MEKKRARNNKQEKKRKETYENIKLTRRLSSIFLIYLYKFANNYTQSKSYKYCSRMMNSHYLQLFICDKKIRKKKKQKSMKKIVSVSLGSDSSTYPQIRAFELSL